MPENKIITFKQDTKERKGLFKAASFSHPAKMILGLQIYLIEHYTKPGDTILDPMAGSGTILMACTLGRNVVCVELEDKFVKMQNDNWQKIKSLGPMLGFTMGAAVILQGDARNLDGLLADNILFSPPYSGTEPVADQRFMKKMAQQYENGILPGKGHGFTSKGSVANYSKYAQSKDNIGNLPYGEISAVISSPPYEGVMDEKRHPVDKLNIEKRSITNYADAVITSPPYEASVNASKGKEGPGAKIWSEEKGHWIQHPDFLTNYSESSNNIGNLKSENYLEAMLQVYRQCHRVLKEKGLMVLVVKNFIRDKKIVRLDLDTIKLCEQAGFKLKETLKRKLISQSFWRTIYHQKYPDVPKIEYEEVLVFQRAESRPDGLI